MALDRIGLKMIAPRVRGASILSLGYPDITATDAQVLELLGVKVEKWTEHAPAHKAQHPLPETIDTLARAGATEFDCVDVQVIRGPERIANLNERQDWSRRYSLVINPGTVEHCFDIATAMFNAWRAVELNGALLFVGPLSMMNHGFYNLCPTLLYDFARENGGEIEQCRARDANWHDVTIRPAHRYVIPPECVMYALVVKREYKPERMPTQRRFL